MNNKNYWPLGIVLIIGVTMILIVQTVMFAIGADMEMENKYLTNYQNVDKNINELQIKQSSFLKSYKVEFPVKELRINQNNKLSIKILDKNSNFVENANVHFFLTRPNTNKNNMDFNISYKENNTYNSQEFNVTKIGRYKVIYFIKVGQEDGYFEQDINATKE